MSDETETEGASRKAGRLVLGARPAIRGYWRAESLLNHPPADCLRTDPFRGNEEVYVRIRLFAALARHVPPVPSAAIWSMRFAQEIDPEDFG